MGKLNNLRGTGINKLGWTEGAKMYSTNKRLSSAIEDFDTTIGNNFTNKTKVICSKCNKSFKVKNGKLPVHRTTSRKYKMEDGKSIWYDESSICNGNVLIPGKVYLPEYTIKFGVHDRKNFYYSTKECVIKPNDNVICEIYTELDVRTIVVEKTIKSIVEVTNYYGRKTIIINCTDGKELTKIKEIYKI